MVDSELVGFLDRNHTFIGSFFPFMVMGPRYSRWNWGSAFSADCKHLEYNGGNLFSLTSEQHVSRFMLKMDSKLSFVSNTGISLTNPESLFNLFIQVRRCFFYISLQPVIKSKKKWQYVTHIIYRGILHRSLNRCTGFLWVKGWILTYKFSIGLCKASRPLRSTWTGLLTLPVYNHLQVLRNEVRKCSYMWYYWLCLNYVLRCAPEKKFSLEPWECY